MMEKCLSLITVGEFRKVARSCNVARIEELAHQLTGFIHTYPIHITPRQIVWMDEEMKAWPSNKRLHIDDVIQCLEGSRLHTAKNAFYRPGCEEANAIMMMGYLYDAARGYLHWKHRDSELTVYALEYLFGWKWSGQIDRTPMAIAKDAIGYARWVKEQKRKGVYR